MWKESVEEWRIRTPLVSIEMSLFSDADQNVHSTRRDVFQDSQIAKNAKPQFTSSSTEMERRSKRDHENERQFQMDQERREIARFVTNLRYNNVYTVSEPKRMKLFRDSAQSGSKILEDTPENRLKVKSNPEWRSRLLLPSKDTLADLNRELAEEEFHQGSIEWVGSHSSRRLRLLNHKPDDQTFDLW